ncbi:MAG: integrase core domain-containing protein, partial [Candidatus Firestonebacteria bacterium]
NSDQGSQFTSSEFISKLAGILISMDGRGRAMDNIFIERLWRSVKYECIYLNGYQNIPEVKEGLEEYFKFYNTERFHQSLDYKTPWQVYSENNRYETITAVANGCCRANVSGFQKPLIVGN